MAQEQDLEMMVKVDVCVQPIHPIGTAVGTKEDGGVSAHTDMLATTHGKKTRI